MSLPVPSSSASESSTVGLSTPHLNDGENTSMSTAPTISSGHIADETDGSINNSKVASVFDIAQGMQEKLDNVVQLLDKHDSDLNGRIETLLQRITKLESSIQQ